MSDGPTARRAQAWLGTYVVMEATAAEQRVADAAVAAAFDAVADVHRLMSFHAQDSDLANLHADAWRQPVTVSPHTWQVILHAQTVAAASDGVFDPTVAPALVASGALPAPTGPRPDPTATWADVELLDGQQIAFRRPLWLDLGGIAKGYAVDRAVHILREYGADSGLVNAGGDLRVFGRHHTRVPVAVRHPAQPSQTLPLGSLAQGAVAGSGDYFAAMPAEQASPIVAPGRGLRPAGRTAVVVVADECWCADALTKVVSLMESASSPVLRMFNATAALLDAHGTLRAMPGFMERLGHATPEEQSSHA